MVQSGSIPDTARHNKKKESVKMDNYKTISTKLANREPFRGNSLRAYWDGEVYKVVSYSTLIAEIGNMGNMLISDRKYSVTTSRHQNLIRRAWGI